LGGIKVFWGGIKCSITVLTSLLPHKKFTWPDFGRVHIIYPICPHHYAPGRQGREGRKGRRNGREVEGTLAPRSFLRVGAYNHTDHRKGV